MRSQSKSRCGGARAWNSNQKLKQVAMLLAASSASCVLSSRLNGATFTYTAPSLGNSAPGDSWSAGTNWNAVPVSAATTTLNFITSATGALNSGVTVYSNDDIAGNFILNALSFTEAGPATGTVPVQTINGNTLEFVLNGSTVPTVTINASGTIKPTLAVNNNVQLDTLTTFSASTAGTFNGVIGGAGGINKTSSNGIFLTSSNTYSGATTINAGSIDLTGANGGIAGSSSITVNPTGILAYDNTSAVVASRLGSAPITLNGGGLSYIANSANSSGTTPTASLGALTLGANAGSAFNFGSSSGTSLVYLPAITRGTHATLVSFLASANTTSGQVQTATAFPLINGILPWAVETSNGEFLTEVSAGSSTFNLGAYGNISGLTSAAYDNNAASNVKITTAQSAFSAGVNENSLVLAVSNNTQGLGGNKLTLTSGGLIFSAGNGTLGSAASDGTVTTGTGNQELFVHALNAGTIASVISDNGASVAVTKDGGNALTLTGNDNYTGQTTIAQGMLTFANTTAVTLTGPVAGASNAVLGRVVGSQSLTLGSTSINQITDNTTTGTTTPLTLNQIGSNVIGTINGAAGANIVFSGDGTGFTTLNNQLNTNGQQITVKNGTVVLNSGITTRANFELDGGLLTLTSGPDRLSFDGNALPGGQVINIAGGQLTVPTTTGSGLRFGGISGGNSSGSNGITTIVNQTSGTVSELHGSAAFQDFSLGSTSTTDTVTYNLSGGVVSVLPTNGLGFIGIGADTGGSSQTAFNFSGGKLLVNNAIQGFQGTGAKQAFVWTGGTLATFGFVATNLTSAVGTAVSATTNTLNNGGGTLAPGDIGTTGKTTITGNYQGGGGNSTLAFDLNGTNPSAVFQDTGAGSFDLLSVSGNIALNDRLNVTVTPGFAPTPAQAFQIVTAGGAITGAFTNLVGSTGVTTDGGYNYTVTEASNSVTLSNFTAVPEPGSLAIFALTGMGLLGRRRSITKWSKAL